MQDTDKKLYAMRHSAAHVLASAVTRLWPKAKLGVGPVINNGFYYDIDLGEQKISDTDFSRIESEMKKIIEADQKFEQFNLGIEESIDWAAKAEQPYKLELLNDLKRTGTTKIEDLEDSLIGIDTKGASKVSEVSFYRNGEFTDLCRGPHVEKTGNVGAFKLIKVSGVYWRGKEENPQMQRVYGLAFETQEELDKYLDQLEEAKKRDHRKIGKEMNLFTFSPLVGSGLPLFTPKGTVLRDKLNQYSQQLREAQGFELVAIPHITKTDLYKTSGHWDKFGDQLFLVKSQETSDDFALKPMNCPHHTQIFASEPRSYKDLPVKYMETTTVYRDEKSGELNGIERVRSATQDDCHVFCTRDQIGDSIASLIVAVQEMYKVLGMPISKVHLSFRDDSEAYLGDKKLWQEAEAELQKLVELSKLDYIVDKGEAAFYGPKIDFIATDALGRTTQVATIQLDFVQPARFELEYIDADGSKKTPVMIHSALLGSIERFLSVYIEHTAGHFPFWLAPEQIRILTINDKTNKYVEKITGLLREVVLMAPLKYNELRYRVDERNESLGKKIRDAQQAKVPLIFIVGPRDEANEEISARTSAGESKIMLSEVKDFLNNHQQNIA